MPLPMQGMPQTQGIPPLNPAGPPPQGQLPVPQGPPQPPQIPPEILQKLQGLDNIARAIRLLRNDRLRGFRVSLEVDSQLRGEREEDKQSRIAAIGAITNFMQTTGPMVQQMPDAAPYFGNLLQFLLRGFNIGRELEMATEDFTEMAEKAAKKQQGQPQQNPQMLQAQAAMMKAQADVQGQQAKMQSDQQQSQAEVQRQMIENKGEAFNSMQDTQQKQMDLEMRKIELQIELEKLKAQNLKTQADMHGQRMDMAAQQQDHALDLQSKRMDMQHSAQSHQQQLQQGFQRPVKPQI